nr:hypothetical protein [Tanacetum cinerariifolium]
IGRIGPSTLFSAIATSVLVVFYEKRGIIFNSNKEVVMIASRVRDVYVLDMTSSAQESCFFAKASENLNWLWHKRLAHLNFKTINKLNNILVNFCDEKEISQNFFSPYTPEQNGIVERKNRTLIEAARTMLSGSVFSKQYWTEDVATACYTQNRSTIVKRHLKTPYEIFHQNGQTDQNDQTAQTDEILNDNLSEHSNHNNDEQIMDNLPNTKDILISKHLPSLNVEDTSVQDIISIPNLPLPIPSVVTQLLKIDGIRTNTLRLNNLKEAFQSTKKNISSMLKKYDISGSSVKTIMVPPNNLGPDLSGKAVNESQYRGMIGSLMYLTASRPDIQFSTCLYARYQANPKESYLIAIKRIFKYLKGTPGLGMWYPKCLGFDLKEYSESDYADCNMDRKSTSDYDIIFKKVPIFCDNTSAIAISNNSVLHSRTKHIDIRYHFIKDHILKGDIELDFIPTQHQLADIFTKPLDEPTFKRLIVEICRVRGDIGITTFRNALRAQYLPHSSMYVFPPFITIIRPRFATIRYNGKIKAKGTLKKICLPPRWRLLMGQIIQCLGGKTGGLDQISNKDATILYCLANGVQVDYAKLIWDDLIHKLNKKTREKIIPYPSVHNGTLKPNQPEELPFSTHMKAICKLDVPMVSKAPKPSSQTEEVPQGKKPGAKSRLVRNKQEKDKIGTKPDQIKKKQEAQFSDVKAGYFFGRMELFYFINEVFNSEYFRFRGSFLVSLEKLNVSQRHVD